MLSTDDTIMQKGNLLLRLQFLYEDKTFQLLSFGAFLVFSKQIQPILSGKEYNSWGQRNTVLSPYYLLYCYDSVALTPQIMKIVFF